MKAEINDELFRSEKAFVAEMPGDSSLKKCITCKYRAPFYGDCQNGDSPLFSTGTRACSDDDVCRLWESW